MLLQRPFLHCILVKSDLFKLRPFELFGIYVVAYNDPAMQCFTRLYIGKRKEKTLLDYWTERCNDQKITNGLTLSFLSSIR